MKLFAIILLALVLPVSAAQAETVDDLRTRALQAITNQMVGPLKMWSIKGIQKSDAHESIDKRSKVKSISCSPGPKSSPVLHLEIHEKGQDHWQTKITFSDKVEFLPPDGGPPRDIPVNRLPSVMVSIDSGSPHLKKAKLSTGERMYADFPRYMSDDGTNSGKIGSFVLKASYDGLLQQGKYGEVYSIPLRRNTIPDATALCKAMSADEIQTILKRIQDGVK